jgi:hypothetical protein
MKTIKKNNLIGLNLLTLAMIVITMVLSLQSKAQTDNKDSFLQLIGKDPTTIDAIAGYDQKVQSHILRVAQTPELLNKIEELQKKSQNQFRAIIAKYDQETQEAFYELARYPNLITDLVSNGKSSVSEVIRIASNYPEDIHAIAQKYTRSNFDALVLIDQLNNEIDRQFKAALEPFDPQTCESVNVLIGYPEIVSALVKDKPFTTLLGEVYRVDPDWVVDRLNQTSQELAQQKKEDLNAYKNQIQKDPEAYSEMLAAADKFAQEKNEVRTLDNSYDPNVDVQQINSYPFWFGYPYWYSAPYWRPLPYYYHTGFYRNFLGDIIFFGLPSFQFLHWQTYYHPTLFPHLSYNYYSYYQNRYHNSQRSARFDGFSRSIQANVINNPRVNNSANSGRSAGLRQSTTLRQFAQAGRSNASTHKAYAMSGRKAFSSAFRSLGRANRLESRAQNRQSGRGRSGHRK